jgi:MerR family transcriptional regulator, copper efflux regulator
MPWVEDGTAQLILYDFPIGGSLVHGFLAARAARCAGAQPPAGSPDGSGYWPYRDLLYGEQGSWSPRRSVSEEFIGYARDIGLDGRDFERCLLSDRFADVVTANRMIGDHLGVRGTPTVMVNNLRVTGSTIDDVNSCDTTAAKVSERSKDISYCDCTRSVSFDLFEPFVSGCWKIGIARLNPPESPPGVGSAVLTSYHSTGFILVAKEGGGMDGLKSGEVAERAGIGVEALRFYQRKGLVPEPPRSANGYRRFPPDTVRRLRFIQRAQAIGFSLAEIGELLELRVDAETDCDAVRQRAAGRLREVEEKIRDLERVRASLSSLVDACARRSASSECPILDALEPTGTP